MLYPTHWCLRQLHLQCKSKFNRNEVLLLMIENFETNQIVLCMPGGCILHFKPPKLHFGPLTPPLCPCLHQSYKKGWVNPSKRGGMERVSKAGEAQGKSRGAALPARGKTPSIPSLLLGFIFYLK